MLSGPETCAKVGNAAPDGGLNVAKPVAELNPFHDLGQAGVELGPFLLGGLHQLEAR